MVENWFIMFSSLLPSKYDDNHLSIKKKTNKKTTVLYNCNEKTFC